MQSLEADAPGRVTKKVVKPMLPQHVTAVVAPIVWKSLLLVVQI